MIAMTAAAHCHRCTWTTAGTPDTTDKAADKHTRTSGHPTATVMTPGGTRT